MTVVSMPPCGYASLSEKGESMPTPRPRPSAGGLVLLLMLVQALATKSDRRRYFHASTADSPGGTWTPLADTEADPFLRATNVTSPQAEPPGRRTSATASGPGAESTRPPRSTRAGSASSTTAWTPARAATTRSSPGRWVWCP